MNISSFYWLSNDDDNDNVPVYKFKTVNDALKSYFTEHIHYHQDDPNGKAQKVTLSALSNELDNKIERLIKKRYGKRNLSYGKVKASRLSSIKKDISSTYTNNELYLNFLKELYPKLKTNRRYDKVFRSYCNLPFPQSNFIKPLHLEDLISYLMSSKNLLYISTILKDLKESNLMISTPEYNSLLTAITNTELYNSKSKSNSYLNDYENSFNFNFNDYDFDHQITNIFETYQQYKPFMEPTIATFNILLETATRLKSEKLYSLILMEMKQLNLKFDRITYYILMKYYGELKRPESLIETYKMFINEGKIVDVYILSQLIDSLLKCDLIDLAKQILYKLEKNAIMLSESTGLPSTISNSISNSIIKSSSSSIFQQNHKGAVQNRSIEKHNTKLYQILEDLRLKRLKGYKNDLITQKIGSPPPINIPNGETLIMILPNEYIYYPFLNYYSLKRNNLKISSKESFNFFFKIVKSFQKFHIPIKLKFYLILFKSFKNHGNLNDFENWSLDHLNGITKTLLLQTNHKIINKNNNNNIEITIELFNIIIESYLKITQSIKVQQIYQKSIDLGLDNNPPNVTKELKIEASNLRANLLESLTKIQFSKVNDRSS